MHFFNLIIFSIISIFTEFSLAAWNIIPRDNSTTVDALNTLGCIQSSNISVPLDIYIDDTNSILLQTNASLSIYDSDIKIIARCYWIFGFNIGYSLQNSIYANQKVTYLGSLEQVLENRNIFPEVYREPFYQSSTVVIVNKAQIFNKKLHKLLQYFYMSIAEQKLFPLG